MLKVFAFFRGAGIAEIVVRPMRLYLISDLMAREMAGGLGCGREVREGDKLVAGSMGVGSGCRLGLGYVEELEQYGAL